MQLGFAIDHRKCIGCHACTVACKAENEVPLGNFRTWVKYVEKGKFPQVRRHFTVLRCNHCDAAPCVEICPVNALHKRPDAIVDLDRDLCIGCRACMQACPYDALYFHEDRGVAEKCHYCAHRTELGLEPACVIVCPVEAIVSGDVADPTSRISALIKEHPTSRRKLEKGTQPRVWYVDALPEALQPGAAAEPSSYLWSQRAEPPPPVVPGFEPTPDITTTLDVEHPAPWGWHVWTYLLTKNVAAGAALAAPGLSWMGVAAGAARDVVPEIVALAFLAVTTILLVHDLGRPERFLNVLLRPNTRSWLVRGAWVLTAFGGLLAAILALRLLGRDAAADALRWANVPVAVLAAGYTAWLLEQCRGRDLWLDAGWIFTSLVARAALLGAGLAVVLPSSGVALLNPAHVFAGAAALNGVLLLVELRRRSRTADGRKAHAIMKALLSGPTPAVTLLVLAAAAVLLAVPREGIRTVELVFRCALVAQAVVTLLVVERAFIRAGQEVPLS
jgi:Fe-S-cluster-containing dehydrogenase component